MALDPIANSFANGSFAGKVAVVTGSTQGLGAATASLFAARGAAGLIISGRNVERGEAVAAALTSSTTKAVFVPSELSDADSCLSLIGAADAEFGRIDVLVNAAAYTVRGSIVDTTVELWDRMMNINARAPFLLTQAAVAVMRREQIAGSIVNVSSVAAHGGQEFLNPYTASKAALNAWTKNTAFALAPDRIRVNVIAPGWMNTEGEDLIQRRFHEADDGWHDSVAAEQPFGRLIDPNEAARAIAFAASDESGLMTGAIIDFDQRIIGTGTPENPGVVSLKDTDWGQAENLS